MASLGAVSTEPRRDRDCLFCRIVAGEVPADVVGQDAQVVAFRDVTPQAPVHVLFVPKTPIRTMDEVVASQAGIIGKLAIAAADYARQQGLATDGYRLVINCNRDGGQTVFQLHLHLLAGAPLGHFGVPRHP